MLAFADLVRQGKVLYVGVSEWSAEQISHGAELARELRIPLVASQPQYSMLWRVIEEEVVPASRREGMGQIVWSPQAQGVLSGKYFPGETVPAGSRAADPAGKGFMDALAGRWMADDALTAVQNLRPIAEEAGLSLPQLALAWVLQIPEVSAAIIGASRPEQVRENAQASGVRLTDEVMRRIDGVLGEIVERDPSKSG